MLADEVDCVAVITVVLCSISTMYIVIYIE